MKVSVEEVKAKIDEFFGDTSRSQEETLSGLEEIAEHVDTTIEAVKCDMPKGDR